MFPLFDFFGRTVGSYALCAIVGIVVSCFYCYFLGRKKGIKGDDIIITALVGAGGSIVGGHILYAAVNYKFIFAFFSAANKNEAVDFILSAFSGSVYYGGLFGSLVAVKLFLKYYSVNQKDDLFNIYVIGVPLFHSFGRIGCFLGGCCYGIESSFGFTVHNNTLVPEINGVSRFPVALFEAFFNFLICMLLTYIFKKNSKSKLISIYFLCYAPLRFMLEFLRGDRARGVCFGLSTSQWISIAILVYLAISALLKTVNKYRSSTEKEKASEK